MGLCFEENRELFTKIVRVSNVIFLEYLSLSELWPAEIVARTWALVFKNTDKQSKINSYIQGMINMKSFKINSAK